ncbi:MAG: fibronectin type III domain-containing protein, partial [Clostridia bacterium]|nr:fibronectin type III domain-containing protein [Clostridia bacterium]
GNEYLIQAFWHISSPECGDNLTWTFSESTGELKITGKGTMWGFLEDLPPWYDYHDQIKKVTLPNGLTSISSCAFINCSNLTEITIPDGVTYFGIYAFRNCAKLQKITFYKSVTEVMESAFSGCTSLKDVYYYGTPQDRSGMRIDESYDQTSDGNDPLLKAEWHFQSAPIPVNNAKIVWNQNDVSFKGSTAYVIYNKKAQTPRFSVTDANGTKIDAPNYTYEFEENTKPGTGYLFVTFTGNLTGSCSASFKIYLPATEWMTVENVAEGIKLTWASVDGAAGYVIYRRARNTTTNQWTDFARWNNTTETSYIDGADSNHRVYIGSRYQYGVKAYFARRLDPIANQQIGGNVNDNSGNWNLGEIGPLKTMVRITTRKLISVTSGKQQLTVNWDASKNVTGYDIQLATDAAFTKNVKTERVDDWKTASKTIKGLKSKTTYYVRVRSYQKIDSMTYFGQWSNVLSAKTR